MRLFIETQSWLLGLRGWDPKGLGKVAWMHCVVQGPFYSFPNVQTQSPGSPSCR